MAEPPCPILRSSGSQESPCSSKSPARGLPRMDSCAESRVTSPETESAVSPAYARDTAVLSGLKVPPRDVSPCFCRVFKRWQPSVEVVTHWQIFDKTSLLNARRPTIAQPCHNLLSTMCPRVFSFSTDSPPIVIQGPVVQKKEAGSHTRLTSSFNSVYERRPKPLQIKNYTLKSLCRASHQRFPAVQAAIRCFYLLQNSHRSRFSRCSICFRQAGFMLLGR